MDTELITIDRTAMIPTRIARQLTPMLFSGANNAERTVLGIFSLPTSGTRTRAWRT